MNNDKKERPSFRHLAYMLGMYSNRTIPQTYINEMSNYELLLALMNKVNEIIDRTIEYDDIMIQIQALLDELEDTIKADVERILNEMYENGEFDEILENIFDEYFENVTAPKEFKVDTRREFRVALWAQSYNAETIDEELYSYAQGSHLFERNGIRYYVACYKVSNSANAYFKTNSADVRLYIYLDNSWQLLRHRVYPTLGHANDIKYMPAVDKFFVTVSTAYNQEMVSVGTKEIDVLDWELPVNMFTTFSLSYVPESDRITCLDYYDGKYYAFIGSGGEHPMWIYTFDLLTDLEHQLIQPINITHYASITVPYNSGAGTYVMQGAGFCQNADFMFFGNTSPAGVYRWNKHTRSLDCFYEIGLYTNLHMFPTGEVEALSIIDNMLYISTSLHANQRYWNWDYNQVFSFDFVNGLSVPTGCAIPYGGFNRTIYVGEEGFSTNIDGARREISNPNGLTGAYGKPFPTWSEAIQFIQAQEMWNTVSIVALTKNAGEYLVIEAPNKTIDIDGESYYNQSTEEGIDKYARIQGLFVQGGNVNLTRMLVINRVPSDASAVYYNAQIYARICNLHLVNCCLYRYNRPDTYFLTLNRCFGNISVTKNGLNENIAWDGDNTEIYLSTINFHNQWAGTTNYNVIG